MTKTNVCMTDRFLSWTLKIVAFTFGFSAISLLELAFLWSLSEVFQRQFSPRGLGWITLPVAGGFACAASVPAIRKEHVARLFGGAREIRVFFAFFVSWIITVLSYVFLAEPYGYHISAQEWASLIKWLLVPPGVFGLIGIVFRWALRGS